MHIDPSEVKITDARSIRARLWGKPDPLADAPVPKDVRAPKNSRELSLSARDEIRLQKQKAEKAKALLARLDAWLAETPRVTTSKTIVMEAAAKHGVDPAAIMGRRKQANLVLARNEAAYELRRQMPWMSLHQIGRRLGGRDHTTTLYAIRKHAEAHGLPVPEADYDKHRKAKAVEA